MFNVDTELQLLCPRRKTFLQRYIYKNNAELCKIKFFSTSHKNWGNNFLLEKIRCVNSSFYNVKLIPE